MMAVEITTQPGFSAGKPKMLFSGQHVYAPGSDSTPDYDVSADGQRFLMLDEGEDGTASATTQVVVVQNWLEELKRRVSPAGTNK